MTILVLLSILLATSTALLGWFCYKLVFRLNFVSNNLIELYGRLTEFDQHIKFIYELEMYYNASPCVNRQGWVRVESGCTCSPLSLVFKMKSPKWNGIGVSDCDCCEDGDADITVTITE